jgi:hypothetical protein
MGSDDSPGSLALKLGSKILKPGRVVKNETAHFCYDRAGFTGGGGDVADHLLIGILVGLGSGIVALIVIGATTLHRFDTARKADSVRLHRTLGDLHRTIRVEMATVRRDLADVAAAQERHVEALAGRLATLTGEAVTALREHPLPALAHLAELQEHRLTALAGELARLSEVMAADAAGHAKDLRNELLESLRMTLDEFRAAHAAQVEQVRAAVDENLERTIERRVG